MKNKHKFTIENIFRGKELFHKEQAKIPFEDKIKILARLQKLANEIRAGRGHKRKLVWKV
jgi:hypothetical protein